MKKILKYFVLPVLIGVIILRIITPTLILNNIDKYNENDIYNYYEYFITDYIEIRNNIQNNLNQLLERGYDSELYSYAIDEDDDLFIDTLYIKPTQEQENLICISTGVHGIEAYIGAVMVEVFIAEILDSIDTTNTGVVIVSNVNPYGVKYARRFNENNIDLNRNFIIDWNTFDISINKDYPLVVDFLEPTKPIKNYFDNEIYFYSKLANQAITNGVATVTNALVGGQYEYPEGVYYGGTEDSASTVYLKRIFNEIVNSNYDTILYFDIHSGYGSRYDMTIFNSSLDPLTEKEAIEAYGYNNIIAHDSEDFYQTTGDTTEYFYSIANNKNLYATCFEFGTLGNDLLSNIASLKYTVEENQNNKYPTTNETSQKIIDAQYMEMFFPSETKWRETAISSFKDAMNGVLEYWLN